MRKSECGITIYLIAGALRRCARRAIVSHSVPAHHFGWMNHLLSEVAGEGYERLMEVMTAIKSEVTEPMMGRELGYVRFAKTYPHHFRMQRRLFVGTGYSTGGRRFAPRAVASGRFVVRYRQKNASTREAFLSSHCIKPDRNDPGSSPWSTPPRSL